jgi:hypothetical protein
VGENLVTWHKKKQLVVARSSAEAELQAMALGIFELLWLNSGEQLADILTKGVSSNVLHSTLCKPDMRDIFVSA